jgi:hypothetical protein
MLTHVLVLYSIVVYHSPRLVDLLYLSQMPGLHLLVRLRKNASCYSWVVLTSSLQSIVVLSTILGSEIYLKIRGHKHIDLAL